MVEHYLHTDVIRTVMVFKLHTLQKVISSQLSSQHTFKIVLNIILILNIIHHGMYNNV